MISIVVLVLVFLLIAIRHVGRIRFRIWQVMLMGAIAVLITGQITPSAAIKAVNLDVIGFLFGMFALGQALEESGYLAHISQRFFRRGKSIDVLVLLILLGSGALAALLMNDTLAIVGTPLLLLMARRNKIAAVPLLLALAFGVTTGSVLSPIGNPQNLLIALNGGINNPFLTFLRYLAIPTLVNMMVVYFMLKLYYPRYFKNGVLNSDADPIIDRSLALLCQISLILLVSLILVKIALVYAVPQFEFRLTYIALIAALPMLVASRRRLEIVKRLDWSTLVFFTSMFILMASVWDSGIFQSLMERMHLDLSGQGLVLGISVVLSQFISNVPMVALYLPMLDKLGASTGTFMALAAGSTIAGNLTILGAASNVIIIQSCENRSDETITFWEFFRIGLPLTIINVLVYWLFLRLV
jgi:Na+/H+ antiporter NhaD/arsenite permease-like protein